MIQISNVLNVKSKQNTDLHHYLIANYSPSMVKDIYRYAEEASIDFLYLDSDLSALFEYSSCIVRVREDDKLFVEYQRRAVSNEDWSGIIVSVAPDTSLEILLAHLRQRLIIMFTGKRKGILHFYNPVVANYFFEANKEDTTRWLGPIKQVCWHGPKNSSNQLLWCKVESSSFDVSSESLPTSCWQMTPSQQSALETQYNDKILAGFFALISLSVTDNAQWREYRHYINQADELGFIDKADVYAYLTLCHTHGAPDEKELNSVASLSLPEKLHYLESTFKKESMYVS